MLYICVRLFAWWLLTSSATMIFYWLEVCIVFYNLFCRKPRHTSVGKMDSVLEGRQYVSIVNSDRGGVKDKNRDKISFKEGEDVEHDDDEEEEDIYVSRMWKTIATSPVQYFNL